jgi:hypothetical protein
MATKVPKIKKRIKSKKDRSSEAQAKQKKAAN